MNGDRGDSKEIEAHLQVVSAQIWTLAEHSRDNCLFILSLLRTLERLHRQIREDIFQSSLPNTRRELYRLLKDIEETGGWPYIERMRLQSLLANLAGPIQETQAELLPEPPEPGLTQDS